MTPPRMVPRRILAVDPAVRGFGFAVLEGPDTLIDWGRKEARTDKTRRMIQGVRDLIAVYQPDLIVAEDCDDRDSRRRPAICKLLREIVTVAKAAGIPVGRVPRVSVLRAFAEPPPNRTNKESIANRIAERFPELTPSLPPHRKRWMSEDSRINVFDAVAFALTEMWLHATRSEASRNLPIDG